MPYLRYYQPLFKKNFFGMYLQYSVGFTVHQNESAAHIHISTYPHSFGFPLHLDHQRMMAQGTQPLFF